MILKKLDYFFFVWMTVILLTVLAISVQDLFPWLLNYPKELVWPISDLLNFFMNLLVSYTGDFFLTVSWLLAFPIKAAQLLLQSLPWVVILFLFTLLAYFSSGFKLSLFTFFAITYMVVIGYWEESMNTLSLVVISVPFAIIFGFGLGILGFYSKKAERVIMPILDVFQTVPTFAYLLPILLLFGFGTVLGLIASVVYSFPPMVRNTILGLQRVPKEIIESGIMAGATDRQLFWQVLVPSSARQLLLGVNQTTMASLSMVIIASIIGGTADIGWTVLYYIRKAEVGESLLVGIVIALMAIMIDRITSGIATRPSSNKAGNETILIRYRYTIIAVFGSVLLFILTNFIQIFDNSFVQMGPKLAAPMNDWFDAFVKEYRSSIKEIKTFVLFYLMLPTKIGLQEAVSPYTWGFEFLVTHKIIYFSIFISFATWGALKGRRKFAITILLFMLFFYIGLTKMPWPSVIIIYSLLGWHIGGSRLGVGTGIGLSFILVTGVWPEAMISIYLCGIAVIISFISGTLLGIWAANNNFVSAVLRPINDTLQTMPLFVILIPFVMLFKIGDFTALLAIIAYAIVPAIRYAEHGLRNLPEEVIEAAKMMGSTKQQLLLQVKIPLALPVMMLGLNQTIMYGIAMLVIAALVGTNGLEQIVYIGLNDGNFGVGMVAGISMAIIAIIVDRMTKSWSINRSKQLGLEV